MRYTKRAIMCVIRTEGYNNTNRALQCDIRKGLSCVLYEQRAIIIRTELSCAIYEKGYHVCYTNRGL